MPGNAHQFLNDYLDIVRWYDADFIKSIQKDWGLKTYDIDVGAMHQLLKSCGYEHLFVQNMLLIVLAMVILGAIWLGLAIKDYIGSNTYTSMSCMKRKHSGMFSNFVLRFFYVFFLEFCIVVCINLSFTDISEF